MSDQPDLLSTVFEGARVQPDLKCQSPCGLCQRPCASGRASAGVGKGKSSEESRVRRPARPAIGLRQSRHLLLCGPSLWLSALIIRLCREFGGGKCRAFLRRVSYVGCSGSRGSACVVTPRAVSSRIRGPLPRAASPRILSRHAARPRSRAHGPRNTQRRGTGGAADPTLLTPKLSGRGCPQRRRGRPRLG